MTAIAIQYRDDILADLRQGSLLGQVAKRYKVTKQALSLALANDPEYQAALKDQAASLVDQAMQATWDAREKLDIARARGMVDAAFRYAESRDFGTWGKRTHVTVEHVGDLAERLRRARERVIEGTAVAVAPQLPAQSGDGTGTVVMSNASNPAPLPASNVDHPPDHSQD